MTVRGRHVVNYTVDEINVTVYSKLNKCGLIQRVTKEKMISTPVYLMNLPQMIKEIVELVL